FISLHIAPPPRPTLFPYTTLFRSFSRSRQNPPRHSRESTKKRSRLNAEASSRVVGAPRSWKYCVSRDYPASAGKRKRSPERKRRDRKSTRLNSSHLGISYAVFCLK